MKKFELPAHLISIYDQNLEKADRSVLRTIEAGDFNGMWNDMSAYLKHDNRTLQIMSGLACIAIVDSVERINKRIDNGEIHN